MGLKDALLYTLSLPERALRSTSAAVGGVSKIMTDTLLPKSVRGLTFYQYFVGNTQRLLIESLGEVKTGAGAETLPADYLARKIVGNAADAAGLFAFHFSPVWFFALLGDASSGTKGTSAGSSPSSRRTGPSRRGRRSSPSTASWKR